MASIPKGEQAVKGVLEAIRQGDPPLRFDLADNHTVVLGRTDAADWAVPRERFLSRRHVELRMKAGRLTVKRLTNAANPVFHQGQKKEAFYLETGEQLVIGKTRFLFSTWNRKRND